VKITQTEVDYLCNAASEYFVEPVRPEDIVWTYSGVRPLFDDGATKAQEATRDYVLKVEAGPGEAPILNVFGGKLTTYRRLAESALEKIAEAIGAKGDKWTGKSSLPGGEFPVTGYLAEVEKLKSKYKFLKPSHAARLVRLYGTRADILLQNLTDEAGLGRHFGADLYEAEVRYLMQHEWATTAEDILWRRTKLGLSLTEQEKAALGDFFQASVKAA